MSSHTQGYSPGLLPHSSALCGELSPDKVLWTLACTNSAATCVSSPKAAAGPLSPLIAQQVDSRIFHFGPHTAGAASEEAAFKHCCLPNVLEPLRVDVPGGAVWQQYGSCGTPPVTWFFQDTVGKNRGQEAFRTDMTLPAFLVTPPIPLLSTRGGGVLQHNLQGAGAGAGSHTYLCNRERAQQWNK